MIVIPGRERATAVAVIPAKAGIQYAAKLKFNRDVTEYWMPAFAGMTIVRIDASASYFTPSNSTSNISTAFGGITPPAPRAP